MDNKPRPRRRRAGAGGAPESLRSLGSLLEQVAGEKGIAKKVLVESFEAAILAAARRAFGPARELVAQFNEETGEVDLHQYVTVVENVKAPERQLALAVAKQDAMLGEVSLGDDFGFQIFWRPEDAA